MKTESVPPHIATTVHTLTCGGFVLEGAERKPGYMLFHTTRNDEFGSSQRYCFALAENLLSTTQIRGASISANHHKSQLVIIGKCETEESHVCVPWGKFVNLFGGPISSVTPLDPAFSEHLAKLGNNLLPNGLEGRAEELFEIYAHAALEFILGGRVVRWGKARLFEPKPDGLAVPSRHFSALYDAKAYSEGYKVTSDSIRQFKSYVDDFIERYAAFYRLNSIIVISGKFSHKDSTLEERSQELLAKTGVPLSFLTSRALADMVRILAEHPLARRSINWARVFTKSIVRPHYLNSELETIARDQVIRR